MRPGIAVGSKPHIQLEALHALACALAGGEFRARAVLERACASVVGGFGFERVGIVRYVPETSTLVPFAAHGLTEPESSALPAALPIARFGAFKRALAARQAIVVEGRRWGGFLADGHRSSCWDRLVSDRSAAERRALLRFHDPRSGRAGSHARVVRAGLGMDLAIEVDVRHRITRWRYWLVLLAVSPLVSVGVSPRVHRGSNWLGVANVCVRWF